MMQRAYWDGYVRLSLVTFPVRLYHAVTEIEKIRLHKIDRKSGKRIHYQNVTDNQHVVEPDDIVKGYEYEKGRYVPIEDEEIKKLRVESNHMIDIVQFTDMDDIDPIYFERPFFMAPGGKVGEEAFVTLRDALRQEKKVALGQVTIAGKERIAAIKACDKGMMLETLRYNYEVRAANEFFHDIPASLPVSKEQIGLAQELIKMKTAPFNPASFKNRYQEGLLEIINAKLHHRKPALGHEPRKNAKVINIMDALKKSLAESRNGRDAPRKRKSRIAKKPSVRKIHRAG